MLDRPVSFCKTLEKEISLGIKDGDFVQGMTDLRCRER